MNQRDQFKTEMHKKLWPRFLVAGMVAIILSCSDYEQTVTTLNQLVKEDGFDTNGAPNSALWGYDIGTGTNGFVSMSAPNIQKAGQMPWPQGNRKRVSNRP